MPIHPDLAGAAKAFVIKESQHEYWLAIILPAVAEPQPAQQCCSQLVLLNHIESLNHISIEESVMKAIEKVSNPATKPMATISINKVEFSTKKFWLPLIFGASLVYAGNPPHAGEQQGTSGQSTQAGGSQGEPGKWGRAFRIENQGGAGGGREPDVNMGNRPGGDSAQRGKPDVNMGNRPGGDPANRGKPDVNMGNRPGGDPTRIINE